jgi:hypothetical protein
MSRLILAGCGARRCFIEYETGGMVHSFHLIGFTAGGKPHLLWSGHIGQSSESVQSLRTVVGQRWDPGAAL